MKRSMRTISLSLSLVLLALLSFGTIASAAAPNHPILVTSAGQSRRHDPKGAFR